MQNEQQNKERLKHFNPERLDTREAGDEALSNLRDDEETENAEVGYTNEERIAEDGEGVNEPSGDENPAGTGIPSKE